MPILLFLAGLTLSQFAWSYPEFIGYKYSSCITCHYNGNGNGPLNDYGRALWSAEIAGRLFAGNKTDEQLGESSGFLGKVGTPWWLRPGIKTRQLYFLDNPRSKNATTRFITMQAEGNAAILFDREENIIVAGSYGYAPVPFYYRTSPNLKKPKEWISREHYMRWHVSEKWWLYTGFLDKTYGIRVINHTAFSRSRTGLAQNDQAHGMVAQYIDPKWELSINPFIGNLYQSKDLRQKGAAVLFEYELKEASRIGASLLYSSNDYVKNERIGFLSRQGFGHGSAVLFEVGLIKDTPKTRSGTTGYYFYAEGIQKLSRGYHLFVVGQSYKDSLQRGHQDQVRLGTGMLMFPMARTELRVELENENKFNEDARVQKDGWKLLAQIHLSL